jgi:hypothetical protein
MKTYMQLLPLVTDPLLAAIAAGRTYDPYQDDLPELTDAMVAFDTDRAMNYIDLMPNLAVELVKRAEATIGVQRDDEISASRALDAVAQVETWCGDLVQALVRFEVNEG